MAVPAISSSKNMGETPMLLLNVAEFHGLPDRRDAIQQDPLGPTDLTHRIDEEDSHGYLWAAKG